jgi:hypothetical protein
MHTQEFITRFFQRLKEDSNKTIRSLFDARQQIILSDAEIAELTAKSASDSLTNDELIHIFLHTFLVSPAHWTEEFYLLSRTASRELRELSDRSGKALYENRNDVLRHLQVLNYLYCCTHGIAAKLKDYAEGENLDDFCRILLPQNLEDVVLRLVDRRLHACLSMLQSEHFKKLFQLQMKLNSPLRIMSGKLEAFSG